MSNPFEVIDARLSSIEGMLIELKHDPIIKAHEVDQPEIPVGIKEAADYLHIQVPTMYSKVSKREIPAMKRGNRLYFLKSDLLKYIQQGRKKSNEEINADAEEYMKKRGE